MSVTFAVSDVSRASDPPQLRPFADALAARGVRERIASGGPAEIVVGPVVHPLVHAVHIAFAEHRPLVLAPDDLWLCVMHGVAEHVRRNPERLRARFVAHDGVEEIAIIRNDLAPAADPPGDWSTVPGDLCASVLARSTPNAHALRLEFSTTDHHARVAMEVALLDAMSSYFRYSVLTLCGIPEITLLGAPADWHALERGVDALEDLRLGRWLPSLRRVLAEFARAAEGAPDRDFFRAMYKLESHSGGDAVRGWIHALFPYLRDSSETKPRDLAPFFPEHQGPDFQRIKTDDFPSGISRVPFRWMLFGAPYEMELVAGHVGVSFDSATGAVRPRFGHWIAAASAVREFIVTNPGEGAFISPRDARELRTLSTLGAEAEGHSSAQLDLSWCPLLESLEGIETARSLGSLSLLECRRVRTLAPLAGLPLRELSVSQCPELEDVGAIGSLHTLESLSLMRCPNVRGLPPIGRLGNLRRVSLSGLDALPERFRKQLTDPEEIRALLEFVRSANPS